MGSVLFFKKITWWTVRMINFKASRVEGRKGADKL